MVFVIHRQESAMVLHVLSIPIPPPTSLSVWSLWVFPVYQVRALVSCIQPGLVICFTLDGNNNPICKTEKETQMYRTDFWTLWEKARVGCFKRTASKHVYHLGWNRSPAQAGCMRQVLGPGALGRPRGIRWRGRWEGGSGWGTHVNPWLIHVNVWQNPLQYCKVISLQLIKKKEKKKRVGLGTSLVVSWLRTCLPMQGTWVQSSVGKLRSHMPCACHN